MDADISVSELIRRYREKQGEILKTLKPELLAEFQRFESLIGSLQQMVTEERQDALPPSEAGFFKELPRIPLLTHKIALTTYLLRCAEPVSRKQILANTHIPAGSLSSLLRAKEFKQVGRGMWTLREKGK